MRILRTAVILCLCAVTLAGPISNKEEADQKEAATVEKASTSQAVFVTPAAVSDAKETATTLAKETGRQSSSSSSDDDDDDDDDDDLELGVDDDDDDDDDDESPASSDDADDDDDEDYFESFFDDILGDDDDDDDDEDEDVAPAAAQPADAAAEAAQEAEATAEQPADELTGETDSPLASEHAEPVVEKDPTEAAASSLSSVQSPVVVQAVPADDDAEDDEDDDDDDDDVDGGLEELTGDDDDDDDDEDEDETTAGDDDDEDDDDDTDIEDVIEAKRSRSLPVTSQTNTRMPAIYIAKYNRFVDNILGRINRILGKSYDPVRVKLQTPSGGTGSNKKKNTISTKSTNKRKKSKKNKRKSSKRGQTPIPEDFTNKMGEYEVARAMESEAREPAFVLISKTSDIRTRHPIKNVTLEVRASPSLLSSNKRKRPVSLSSSTNKNKNTIKQTASSGSSSSSLSSNTKARATLYGLSTLRRDGDVSVQMLKDYTTVKTDFLLGPLTLRVEKEFGKGSRKQLKSATATTAEMLGKLTLRIVHGGAATLHSIKVLQPKQVRVDSADNHEKTKEYVWKRSSNIASVVSRKLVSAARSMLKPPPTS